MKKSTQKIIENRDEEKKKIKIKCHTKNTIQNIHSRNNRSYNAEMRKKGISEITFHNSRICNIQ